MLEPRSAKLPNSAHEKKNFIISHAPHHRQTISIISFSTLNQSTYQRMDAHLRKTTIWAMVDESTFHSRVRDLHNRGCIADSRSSPASCALPAPPGLYLLSPASEQRLANDVAFLAACQPAGEHVVAATVEATEEKRVITISLAANRGIVENVDIGMKELLRWWERRARKG
jgi:hypothetical protein